MNNFEISVEHAYNQNGEEAILVKIYSCQIEVNIWIDVSDVAGLRKFISENNPYHCAGKSANSTVHWINEGNGDLYILIGEDKDVWDIGLTVDHDFMRRLKSML
jgi:hypothetical protein